MTDTLIARLRDRDAQELMSTEFWDRVADRIEALQSERDCAIQMLSEWCVAVDSGGSAWDDWDEHYKDAMYRPNPIRELLNAAIEKAQEQV